MRLILFFIFLTTTVFSQSKLSGKIISDQGFLNGIVIVNRTQKTDVVSSNGGLFEIEASCDDVLVITSPRIEPIEIRLNQNSFKQNPLEIYVKVKPTELDEIIVRNITAKSLGIVPKNQKEYTPMERRLQTASTGGPVGLVANLITGQKKMLKKAVEYEKYERDADKLLNLLTKDFFQFTLKISLEDLDGFLVFASENKSIVNLLNQKNVAVLKLRLVELAFSFKEMKNEN